MNRHTLQISLMNLWVLALLVLVCLLVPFASTSAGTTVSNSVSVSASGSGESHASVTTVINGEVVEDWSTSSSEPIEYSQTHVSTSSEVNTEIQTSDQQLKAMIAQLEAIISFYVSLLNY